MADQLLPVEKVEGKVFPALCQWKWMSILWWARSAQGTEGRGGNMNDCNNHVTIKYGVLYMYVSTRFSYNYWHNIRTYMIQLPVSYFHTNFTTETARPVLKRHNYYRLRFLTK